jgi:flagellar biosynthesis GTPase FlhF
VPTDQFESHLERIVATLRNELGAAFQQHAADVAQRSAAEREAAIRAAAESARRETQQQIDHVRRTAQEQVEAAKRSAQAEAAARARAEAQVEDVRRIGRTQVEEAQRTMNDRLSAITRELDESRREVAVRRQELDTARGASAASLADLVRGLHAVDEAESLTAVLGRLLDGSRPHSNRAALLLVQEAGLRQWAPADFDVQLGVGERGMAVASSAASERRRVESESALAFPVHVGGEVVAVLYAEVGDALSPQRRISKDALDALTRHAGRMLETLTVQQAAGLRPVRRESAAHDAGASAGDRVP